ncbi:MAG: site-specific DNA-methyltransferase [Flavobacteriaceae bacterium]|nr:site-specific DNA-methyltransferase [Flavobacteriaceae bacterium]
MKSNRHFRDLYVCDNLPVLRSLPDNTIDLIYLDPPFNSKKEYSAPIATKAEGQKFDDTWKWDSLNTRWLGEIDRKNGGLSYLIHTARVIQGDGTAAYLTMMGIRLLEMQRVLKPTGSIHLHCDDTASAYLKVSMDAVFGHENFKNEIIWHRTTAHNNVKKFRRVTDTILFYTKTSKYTWNPETISMPLSSKQLKEKYTQKDSSRGLYRSENLIGRGFSKGESGKPWRGFDPTKNHRHWSIPLTGTYAKWIEENIIPNYRKMKSLHERLDALYNADMIILPEKGKRIWPGLKRYAASDIGIRPQNLILDPIGFTNFNKKGRVKGDEYTGWATQKPLELIRPLIKVSSNPGDLVLDPFCGCATACVAAEMEQRQWIGIDLCEEAETITKYRLDESVSTDLEATTNGVKINVIKQEPKPYIPIE